MTPRLSRSLLTLFLILGLQACGCGARDFIPEADADGETDGDDVGDDVPIDGEPDVPADTPTETPTDGEDDDGGGSRVTIPFEVETSGGGRMTSSSYTLELFTAPLRPVGTATSANYTLKLGPAGIRSHR